MAAVKKKKRRKRKGRYHRGLHVSPKAGECKYRSGWELAYMVFLDGNSDVIKYDYEKLVIEYISNVKSKRVRRYFPDFHVFYSDGRVEVIEIKPKRRMTNAAVVKKAKAAVEWCRTHGATYIMLTEVELKSQSIM
jgi:hypothetical protein